jgi:hypothetical protein
VNGEGGETYRFEVRLDKGVGACDDAVEEVFDAGFQTSLTLNLNPPIYAGQSVEIGVRATDSEGRRFCTAGVRVQVEAPAPIQSASSLRGHTAPQAQAGPRVLEGV